MLSGLLGGFFFLWSCPLRIEGDYTIFPVIDNTGIKFLRLFKFN